MVGGHPCVAVNFSLCRGEAQHGEAFRIVGAHPGLGAWDPLSGPLLESDPDATSRWHVSVKLDTSAEAARAMPLEYKYVRDRRSFGEGFVWEDCIVNRKIDIPLRRIAQDTLWLAQDFEFNAAGAMPLLCTIRSARVSVAEITKTMGSTGCSTDAGFDASYALVGARPLGNGTSGSVWRCRRHGCAGMPARAVKCITKAGPSNAEDIDVEIGIHLGLRHPHIAELFEVFDEPCCVSIVMELCEGGDLLDFIADHEGRTECGLPEDVAATAMRHLLSALEYLHDRRIVHRDVKCENLLLADKGAPASQTTFKLCDFGLAASVPVGGMLHARLGTPDGVSPEVAAGLPYSTPTDLWSAGVVLYTMLSATAPFSAASEAEVLGKVRAGVYSFDDPAWSPVSEEAKALVRSLMNRDQHARITAGAAGRHPWVGGGGPGGRAREQRPRLETELPSQRCGVDIASRHGMAAVGATIHPIF